MSVNAKKRRGGLPNEEAADEDDDEDDIDVLASRITHATVLSVVCMHRLCGQLVILLNRCLKRWGSGVTTMMGC